MKRILCITFLPTLVKSLTCIPTSKQKLNGRSAGSFSGCVSESFRAAHSPVRKPDFEARAQSSSIQLTTKREKGDINTIPNDILTVVSFYDVLKNGRDDTCRMDRHHESDLDNNDAIVIKSARIIPTNQETQKDLPILKDGEDVSFFRGKIRTAMMFGGGVILLFLAFSSPVANNAVVADARIFTTFTSVFFRTALSTSVTSAMTFVKERLWDNKYGISSTVSIANLRQSFQQEITPEKLISSIWKTLQKMFLMEIWRRAWARWWSEVRVIQKKITSYSLSLCQLQLCPEWLVRSHDFVETAIVRGSRKIVQKIVQGRVDGVVKEWWGLGRNLIGSIWEGRTVMEADYLRVVPV